MSSAWTDGVDDAHGDAMSPGAPLHPHGALRDALLDPTRFSDRQARADRLLEADGAGTMTLQEPALNLAVEAVLSAQASARARTAKAAAFFKDSRNRMVVPLKITGPAANPAVNLDNEKVAQKGMGRSSEKNFESLLKQKFRR